MAINYTASITTTAQNAGIDPGLALAVAQAESSLNPNAISPVGAVGLFQLMQSSFPGVDIHDPITNIDTGVNYLAKLLDQYDGDTSLALAAYNAGPGNVHKYGGIPPFAETQNYVAKILGMLGVDTSTSTIDTVDNGSDSLSIDTGGIDPSTIVIGVVAVLGIGIALLK